MDIRNWPLNRIMQLPDHCFGSRRPLVTTHQVAPLTTLAWLVKAGVSERIVLWELGLAAYNPSPLASYIRFALGDQEPTTEDIFDSFEPLFPGDLDDNVGVGRLGLGDRAWWRIICRMPKDMKGRRFAVLIRNTHTTTFVHATIWFVVSSIPTEVPDCLLSV